MAALPDRLTADPLVLERWRPAMVDEVLEAVLASFPELHQWMPWAATVPTRDALLTVLEDGARAFDADEEWQYVVREPGSGPVLGCVGLHRRGGGWLEIGYWVRSERTGRGYATAAAGALTATAFKHLPEVEQVEIHMDRANRASAAVPPKLGYRFVREEERAVLAPGQSGRAWVWQIGRGDWQHRVDAHT